MRRLLSGFFLLGFLCLVSAEDNKPCTAHADGKYYDLSHFKGRKDFELNTPGGRKLAINVCQGVTTELWGLEDGIKATDVAGFVHRDHGDFSIGKVNTTLSVEDSRPRLVYSEGSSCKSTPGGSKLDIKGSTIIEFICDTSIFGAGQPRLVGQLPPGDDEIGCSYFIEWKTHFACPTSEDGGVWGFFAMLAVAVLILLLTYTVLGTLYNRYVLQLRGFDQIPQFSVESMQYHAREAADWIKDIIAAYNIGGNGGRLPYASTNARTTNPASHHTQASEDLNINTNSTFVRPTPSSARPTPHPNTNPVSHHVQSQTEILNTQPPSNSPPTPPPKQSIPPFAPRRVDLGSRGPTKEEREFMLGDDEDEGEELEDKSTPTVPATTPQAAESSTHNVPTQLNRGNANTTALRRDNGQGSIRL